MDRKKVQFVLVDKELVAITRLEYEVHSSPYFFPHQTIIIDTYNPPTSFHVNLLQE